MIDWLARSPDLNLVENIFTYFVKVIYAKNKQFNKENELWDSISKTVLRIPRSYIEAIYNSMSKRLCEVFKKQGKYHWVGILLKED